MQNLVGFLGLVSMIGAVVGTVMCLSPVRRQTGKTVALASVACFTAMAVVLGARTPAQPTVLAAAQVEPKPEKLSRSQMLANFRIRALSWHKDGFGTVMMASFVVHNDNPMPVRDIEITCGSSGPSGSLIDKNTRTVYEAVRGRSFLQVDKMNMGFIRSEATATKCVVTDFANA